LHSRIGSKRGRKTCTDHDERKPPGVNNLSIDQLTKKTLWQVASKFPKLPIPQLAFGHDPQAVIITSDIPNTRPNIPPHSLFQGQSMLHIVKFGMG